MSHPGGPRTTEGTPTDLTLASLDNGIRVVAQPVPGCQVVASCLHVGVGFRNELVAGGAHLLEHVLAEGATGSVKPSAAIACVGGAMNARTSLDYTQYLQVMPSGTVDLALEIERDRLAQPDLSIDHIRAQIAVVRAEIQRNILQRAHGGLVMADLPALLHDSWANRHNGYGDLEALESLDDAAARAMFDNGYAPHNITLALVGEFCAEQALDLAARRLGSLPARTSDIPRPPSEARLTRPRVSRRADRIASDARTAVGYRLADPSTDLSDYLATVLLSELLDSGEDHGGTCSRGFGRLHARVNRTGNPFDVAYTSLFALDVSHPVEVAGDDVEQVLRARLADVARWNLNAVTDALEPLRHQIALHLYAELDSVVGQASWLAIGSAVHGNPSYLAELPDTLRSLPADAVRRLAEHYAVEPAARVASLPELSGGRDR